jgi:hypothetical protein
MQIQEIFYGPNKIVEGRRVEKHGNPKQETKPPLCVVFFFAKICILLEQFPKKKKNNKRLKWGKKI